jgi:putative transposase
MVTAGTYQKVAYYNSRKRLRFLTGLLLEVALEWGWRLEAWAVFANHYHYIAKSPDDGAESLRAFSKCLHRRAATWLNRLEGTVGRTVWHNYHDSELTFEKSYLARLNYVINNPVKHGLVRVANQYPWCSAAWFEREATPAFQKTVASFKTDRINVTDDYDLKGD